MYMIHSVSYIDVNLRVTIMSNLETKPILVLVEGADQAGKTTLINKLLQEESISLLEFPKSNNGKPFKIETNSELQCYVSMAKNLDKSVTWVQDRGILSNIVYNENFFEHDIVNQVLFLEQLNKNTRLLVVILDRPYVTSDFKDDLIDVSKDKFNTYIDAYRGIKLNVSFNVINGKILNDNFECDNKEFNNIVTLIKKFVGNQ